MNQKTMPAYLFAVALFLVAGFASMVAVAKNDNANANSGNSDSSVKSEKSAKTEKIASAKKEDIKKYQKPDTSKGETNAKVYQEKSFELAKNLKKAVNQETTAPTDSEVVTLESETATTEVVNSEVKNKAKKRIQEVATEQITTQAETVAAIEEVEEEGAVKKFFFGPDYKNLGQLRSSMVQNENQVRKLTQAINTLEANGESTAELQNQLLLLTQQRATIENVIKTNEGTFSLLGWAAKFMSGYQENPVDEEEEEKLVEEVEEAIENSTETTTEGTTDTSTGTTTPTDPNTETTTPETGSTDTTEATGTTETTIPNTETTTDTGTATPEIVQ